MGRKKNIPIVVKNQVYADIDKGDGTKMVGGDILRYSSKCLIELTRLAGGVRQVTLRKHRSLPDGKRVRFTIDDEGITEVDDGA